MVKLLVYCMDIFQKESAGWIILSYPGNTEKQVSAVLFFITMWNGAGLMASIMSIYGRTERFPKEYMKKAATESLKSVRQDVLS